MKLYLVLCPAHKPQSMNISIRFARPINLGRIELVQMFPQHWLQMSASFCGQSLCTALHCLCCKHHIGRGNILWSVLCIELQHGAADGVKGFVNIFLRVALAVGPVLQLPCCPSRARGTHTNLFTKPFTQPAAPRCSPLRNCPR